MSDFKNITSTTSGKLIDILVENSTTIETVPANISNLKGSLVTDGWDVVTFFSEDKINSLWEQRWKDETNHAFEGDRKFVQSINVTYSEKIPGNIRVDHQLNIDMGAPWLKFITDTDQHVEIRIPIIKGSLEKVSYDKDGNQMGKDTQEINSTEEKPVMIVTRAQLTKLTGNVNMGTVYVDPAQDTFVFENIELDPQEDKELCNEISEYFKKQKLQPWELGTLKLQCDIEFLKPQKFYFRTYVPPDSHKKDWPSLLAVYVLTITPTPPDHGMRQIWPDAAWPVSIEHDAAVYFSANLLWNYEILQAVEKQIGNATVLIDNIDKSTNEYYLKLIGDKALSYHPVTFDKGYSNPPWQTAEQVTENAGIRTFPLSSISLRIQDLTKLDLKCNANWQESLPFQITKYPTSQGAPTVYDVGWDSVTFTCTFDSSASVHIDKDSFEVTFDELKVNPTVTSLYSGSKKNIWNLLNPKVDGNLIDEAKKAIQDYVSEIKLTFSKMSMFAVSNLLFPESKTIEIDPNNPDNNIFFPCDMVIIGNVVETKTQNVHLELSVLTI